MINKADRSLRNALVKVNRRIDDRCLNLHDYFLDLILQENLLMKVFHYCSNDAIRYTMLQEVVRIQNEVEDEKFLYKYLILCLK